MPNRDKKPLCGHCKADTKKQQATAIPCTVCTTWYHISCLTGMSDEFVDNCDKSNRLKGDSNFFCPNCRNFIPNMNGSIHDLLGKFNALEARVNATEARANAAEARANAAELELQQLRTEIERMMKGTDLVKEQIVVMEKEIESGMEQAKKEVKEEMTEEMRAREEKATNIVVYGAKESGKDTAAERAEDDVKFVKDLAEKLEVEIVGEIEAKFRAGKKPEGAEASRPRTLIVKISDDQAREKILQQARFLGRSTDDWKNVYVGLDLTRKDRDEARKKEEKMKEEAKKKTEEESKNGTRTGGRYVVAGMRGRERWLAWRQETKRGA